MSDPTVSVVMSVFNGQQFLAEAVESILKQSFRDFEFVIIDDGSMDKTADILAEYATRDARMRVVRHTNRGRAESLNVGIRLAMGKYIARMDADDIAMPRRFEKQVEFMEAQQRVGLLGGEVELISADRRVIRMFRPPLEDRELREMMLLYNPYHPAVMMRTDVVRAAGGYRKVLVDADDYDVYLRIGERSQLANLAEPILQYRIHPGQVSVQNLRHQTLSVVAARKAASLRRSGRPDPLSVATEISAQFLESLGVPENEIADALVAAQRHWIGILEWVYPESSLHVGRELLKLSRSHKVDRTIVAETWLSAARIQHRLGRPGKAAVSGVRAVLEKPSLAGRALKGACLRLLGAWKADSNLSAASGSSLSDK